MRRSKPKGHDLKARSRLTYANAAATIALFLALGGGAYAATQTRLPKNAIGAKQLRKDSVTSAKVKDGSLLAGDFKPGQLPAGERGPQGPQGAPGATSVVVRYGDADLPKEGEEGRSNARCRSGETVTGGGFDFSEDNEPENFEFFVQADRPSLEGEVEGHTSYPAPIDGGVASGWLVAISNETGDTFTFRSYVLCARP